MTIRDYNPSKGQAFQGDVAIVPVPNEIKVSTDNEISPKGGRLILQEGEVSGHHHAIRNFRQSFDGDPVLTTRDKKLHKAFGGKPKAETKAECHLYIDMNTVNDMQKMGILTRTDLVVGILVVQGNSVLLEHEEHDPIRIPVGRYYIGRQVESAGAEERVVLD